MTGPSSDSSRLEDFKRHNVIDRLAAMERQQAAAVTREQVGRIHERIDHFSEAVAGMAGEMKAMRGNVHLMQKLMMERDA